MLALGVMKEENNMKTIDTLIENYSYEDLAHAMYLMGERDGAQKITDKTQWREFVIAEKLGHKVFVETGQPTVFEDQPHVFKSFRGAYDYCDIDIENLYKSFDKIYMADYYTEDHLKSKTNIVESYCEFVGVEKTSLPYIVVDKDKFNNFNFMMVLYYFELIFVP